MKRNILDMVLDYFYCYILLIIKYLLITQIKGDRLSGTAEVDLNLKNSNLPTPRLIKM